MRLPNDLMQAKGSVQGHLITGSGSNSEENKKNPKKPSVTAPEKQFCITYTFSIQSCSCYIYSELLQLTCSHLQIHYYQNSNYVPTNQLPLYKPTEKKKVSLRIQGYGRNSSHLSHTQAKFVEVVQCYLQSEYSTHGDLYWYIFSCLH